ncbi:MAG: prepilin-type N-terminal cleavage/methylation domain-containing protein [Clostridium sp.]|nr:prepilin-type N-terminal cleavage/methylation domain-containing protein [Clostridium sp.]
MKKNNRHAAFSLAEILLTLAIIGVVSALTIPPLKDYSDEMTIVAQVKKAHSDLSAATAAIETKYGDLKFWPWNDQTAIMNRYAEQIMFNESSGSSRTSQNGMTWYIYNGKDGDGGTALGTGGMAIVDVNTSLNPPNKDGIDRFAFRINENGVLPYGSPDATANNDFDNTYKVINEGKVPAFH